MPTSVELPPIEIPQGDPAGWSDDNFMPASLRKKRDALQAAWRDCQGLSLDTLRTANALAAALDALKRVIAENADPAAVEAADLEVRALELQLRDLQQRERNAPERHRKSELEYRAELEATVRTVFGQIARRFDQLLAAVAKEPIAKWAKALPEARRLCALTIRWASIAGLNQYLLPRVTIDGFEFLSRIPVVLPEQMNERFSPQERVDFLTPEHWATFIWGKVARAQIAMNGGSNGKH